MNPNAVISFFGIVALAIVIEHSFKPRFDITEYNDFILWYYNKSGERVFTILYHF